MEFHAHIYFDETTAGSARSLRATLERDRLPGLEIGPLEHELRGPHARPMFELRFDERLFGRVLLWLLFHRGGHHVLVHAVTGDDPLDHELHAMWLGEPLPLDFSRLDPPAAGRAPRFELGAFASP